MKAYKTDLAHFFTHKKEQDNKLKKALSHKTFEQKQAIIKEFRESTFLRQGMYSVNEDVFERKPFIRDIYYLEQLNEEIRIKTHKFNIYKYDSLYELAEFDEATYDAMETEIIELKRKREEYISKRSNKLDELNEFNERVLFNVNVQIEAFNAADKEDKKEIYEKIIKLKKLKFDRIRPQLSMMNIDKYKTVVTDYLPIKGNEKNILNLSASPEEVVLVPDVLEVSDDDSNSESPSYSGR